MKNIITAVLFLTATMTSAVSAEEFKYKGAFVGLSAGSTSYLISYQPQKAAIYGRAEVA